MLTLSAMSDNAILHNSHVVRIAPALPMRCHRLSSVLQRRNNLFRRCKALGTRAKSRGNAEACLEKPGSKKAPALRPGLR